jgi:ribosomal protein S1
VDILIQSKELKELSRETNTKQGAINQAKVIKIDNQTRRIYVSIKSAELDDMEKYSASLELEQNKQYSTLNSMKKKK